MAKPTSPKLLELTDLSGFGAHCTIPALVLTWLAYYYASVYSPFDLSP